MSLSQIYRELRGGTREASCPSALHKWTHDSPGQENNHCWIWQRKQPPTVLLGARHGSITAIQLGLFKAQLFFILSLLRFYFFTLGCSAHGWWMHLTGTHHISELTETSAVHMMLEGFSVIVWTNPLSRTWGGEVLHLHNAPQVKQWNQRGGFFCLCPQNSL